MYDVYACIHTVQTCNGTLWGTYCICLYFMSVYVRSSHLVYKNVSVASPYMPPTLPSARAVYSGIAYGTLGCSLRHKGTGVQIMALGCSLWYWGAA